jgi:hypothetical protein
MSTIRILFVGCALCLIVGCSAQPKQHKTADAALVPVKKERLNAAEQHTDQPPEPLTAIQILKQSGLMPDDNYVFADFIPNSNNTMIVADIRDVPCKMIFRHITTTNGDYWMPNQIGCSP